MQIHDEIKRNPDWIPFYFLIFVLIKFWFSEPCTAELNCLLGASSQADIFKRRCIRRMSCNEQRCCKWAAWLRCSVGHNWLLLTLPLLSSMYFGSIQNNFTTRPTYPTFFGYGHLFFTARPKKL